MAGAAVVDEEVVAGTAVVLSGAVVVVAASVVVVAASVEVTVVVVVLAVVHDDIANANATATVRRSLAIG